MTHAPAPGLLLASASVGPALGWLALLGGLALVFVAGLLLIRRAMLGRRSTPSPGLLMDDLRRMLAEGTLSPEEFRRARDAVIRSAGAHKPGDAAPGRTPPESPD